MGEAAQDLFGGIETGEDIKDKGDFLGRFFRIGRRFGQNISLFGIA